MSVMLQVRNVPDALHRTLKARAALKGVSLSDYCLAELRRAAETPSVEELAQRIRRREPLLRNLGAAELIRGEPGTDWRAAGPFANPGLIVDIIREMRESR